MPTLSQSTLADYRATTFRLRPDLRLATLDRAVDFVNQRGFVHLWPVKGVTLPSLWAAVAGERPVADEHDDPGHVTWGWKDQTLGARRWYYAKVLRKRATFIALDLVPHFYALSENYGEPAEDYLLQYQEGRMTFEAKSVYETLLNEGPLDSIRLRTLARVSGKAASSRFSRALEMLQVDFKVLPVGVAQAGAWRYAFIYDLVHRFYPDLPAAARPIRQGAARQRLAGLYLQAVGAAEPREIATLFGWTPADTAAALDALLQAGEVVPGVEIEGRAGEVVALAALL